MLKKIKKKKISTLRNKADKLSQELFVKLNPICEGCGQPTSCGHHFWPKSMSSSLRYNFKNWVAVCQGCHFRHHNGCPELHQIVLANRGQDWYDDLLEEKNKYVKVDRFMYERVIRSLELSLSKSNNNYEK